LTSSSTILSPRPQLNLCWGCAIVDDPAFNQTASARQLDTNFSISVAKCVPGKNKR
jgi:hypothetical protein